MYFYNRWPSTFFYKKKCTLALDPLPPKYSLYTHENVDNCELPLNQWVLSTKLCLPTDFINGHKINITVDKQYFYGDRIETVIMTATECRIERQPVATEYIHLQSHESLGMH